MITKIAIIGCGIKAQQYFETWVARDDIEIIACADINSACLESASNMAQKLGKPSPALFADWPEMLTQVSAKLDAVYISSPHAFHAEQAIGSLNAGLDVLLEKPMVMTVDEAKDLMNAEKNAGKQVVVAYQGGLSPLVHQLSRDVANQTYGTLISISATIWEGYAEKYRNHWKQNEAISGGGFMFDTGAHMMNTVSLLCDSELSTICALMDKRDYPVDTITTAIGKLQNGTLFSLHASGITIDVCQSRIELFFSDAIVRICAWGRWMEIQRDGMPVERHEQEAANNLMDTFIKVRGEKMGNPSTTEQGLRMAKLWDAIKLSAKQDGVPVSCN